MKLTRKFRTSTFLFCSGLLLWFLRWPIMQGIAWAGMMWSYSKAHGVRKSWEMTLSGDYPCALCLAIRTGVESEAAILSNLFQNPTGYAVGALTILLLAAVSILRSFCPKNDCL